jgi:hypothetical protein
VIEPLLWKIVGSVLGCGIEIALVCPVSSHSGSGRQLYSLSVTVSVKSTSAFEEYLKRLPYCARRALFVSS